MQTVQYQLFNSAGLDDFNVDDDSEVWTMRTRSRMYHIIQHLRTQHGAVCAHKRIFIGLGLPVFLLSCPCFLPTNNLQRWETVEEPEATAGTDVTEAETEAVMVEETVAVTPETVVIVMAAEEEIPAVMLVPPLPCSFATCPTV
jgi:hypothetical protein